MKLRRMLWTLILIFAVSFSNLCSAAALHYGDRGEKVKEIQEYLIAQCLLNAAADGVYGLSTVDAIKEFQGAIGLEVDGVCGELTYKILRAAAYDEIDITTFKLGDYIPEHVDTPENSGAADVVLNVVNTVKEVAEQVGVGDVIKLGMEGDGVVYLQTKLIEHGYYDGETNGVASHETINALKNFQIDRGIAADGVCGRRTYSALDGDSNEDYSSDVPNYGRAVRVEATAYSPMQPGMSSYTATGAICQRGIIATDPNFIPLGTKVFIPGYGYAIAADTGGAIVGNIIDIAFDTVGECYEWGRQYLDIYIID